MMMINQLKAARALLGWRQEDLAQASGVSRAALAALEQGKGKTRGATLEALRAALEAAGVEFTPDPGVRLRREKFAFQIFEYRESVFQLWEDIERALGQTGGEVLVSGVDETAWLQRYTKEEIATSLRRKRALGIYNRLLICEDDPTVLIGPEAYRAIPRVLFQQTPYLVYADRLAIVHWGPPQRIMLIQNAMVAETFRRQFEFNWQLGRDLDPERVVVVALGESFEKHLPERRASSRPRRA